MDKHDSEDWKLNSLDEQTFDDTDTTLIKKIPGKFSL